MTIDEAIRILKLSIRNSREHIRFCYDEKGITALDMAIQALEQEPTVTSTEDNAEMIYPQVEGITPTLSVSEKPNNCDLISREEVLENAFKIYTHECGLLEVVGVATIETLPSIKLQTGHWIIMGDRYIKCSECGHITKTESPDIYHFCMVCGANMSEIPTSSKPEISSYYGLRSYVRERSE